MNAPAPGLVPRLRAKRPHRRGQGRLAKERWGLRKGKLVCLGVNAGRKVYDIVAQRAKATGRTKTAIAAALIGYAIDNDLPLRIKAPKCGSGHHYQLAVYTLRSHFREVEERSRELVGPDWCHGKGVGVGRSAVARAMIEAAAPLCDLSGAAPQRDTVKRRRSQEQMIQFWGPSVSP